MTRKVIIDCAPGIDDAFALTLALFDPRLEVVAVTATEGHVAADKASRNVQAIIDSLDPPRLPRVGAAAPLERPPEPHILALNGDDGLGNTGLAVSRLQHLHPSEKIIIDEVRSAPEQVTILCLGPLTNVARAFQRDVALPALVDRIVIAGGSVVGIGDVTASAELNLYLDPPGARHVFRSRTTKTLVPLDIARKVSLTMDLLDKLPAESSRAGRFLRPIMPFLFRTFHQIYGQESILLHRTMAVVATLHPELFDKHEMAGDVETSGELTRGASIFDRRYVPAWRINMEVALDVDAAAARDCIMRGLGEAGRASS